MKFLVLAPRRVGEIKPEEKVRGIEFQDYLAEQKLLERVVPLNSETVQGWLLNPASYPLELRGKKVLLMTSMPPKLNRPSNTVAALEWDITLEKVKVVSEWLQNILDPSKPTLILSN